MTFIVVIMIRICNRFYQKPFSRIVQIHFLWFLLNLNDIYCFHIPAFQLINVVNSPSAIISLFKRRFHSFGQTYIQNIRFCHAPHTCRSEPGRSFTGIIIKIGNIITGFCFPFYASSSRIFIQECFLKFGRYSQVIIIIITTLQTYNTGNRH